MKLIRNCQLYAPRKLGQKDILMIHEKIAAIEERIEPNSLPFAVEVINAEGDLLVPGFIDQHVHFIGGGGEAGFSSRTPALTVVQPIEAGITTLVGLLGTDDCTRTVEDLYAKAKALDENGLTTFIHTGSYGYPPITLTGSVKRDIVFIDKVIGVKTAIADHRASQLTSQELIRLAAEARVAGMISGKPGIVHIHVGGAPQQLDLIFRAINESNLPVHHFSPTHVARNASLFDDALKFAKLGGMIDMTANANMAGNSSEFTTLDAIETCLKR